MTEELFPVSQEFVLGFEDGYGGFEAKLESDDYLYGHECGQAAWVGDHEPLTDEERKEVYGDDDRI